jgi:cysteinyl-tRNA synthetase
MIAAVLGKTIDIHAGGIDLQFPHQDNEIAQSECAHGAPFANYWLHNGFLDLDGEKMSKSLGNVRLVHQLLAEWPGEVLRFALLSGHYRQPLDFSRDLLDQAKATLDRLYGALGRVWSGDADEDAMPPAAFLEALNDDLNTPRALAELSALAGEANKAADARRLDRFGEIKGRILAAGSLIGLLNADPEDWFKSGGASEDVSKIEALVAARFAARQAKDWAEADRLRAELASLGVEVLDGPSGSTWRRS